ncbi:MAG: gliding motility-associated C-terminal domain-containing protein [Saprospiraceae bacterium]|nr:MAG: PKD domain-containing protein [Bacteroidetes bacterium OLB9]MCO6463020.1 gliding motility-associated C-terminal domain-containing protein [Saprospiraceae bacterium]
MYSTLKIIFQAICILCFPVILYAQEVSFEWKEPVTVCDSSYLFLTLSNNTSGDFTSSEFTLSLPCGIAYKTSTFSGSVSEQDISDLSRPVFKIFDVRAGHKLTFSIQIKSSCTTLACLDRQEIFTCKAEWKIGGSAKTFTSDPVSVESPNLIIYGIEDIYTEIPSFGSRSRNIRLANRRKGRLRHFELTHKHGQYIKVSYNAGTVISSSSEETTIRFDEKDFVKIGNRDGFLDINEEILLIETLYADVCSYDVQFARSEYILKWGCNDEYCQQHSAIANVRFIPNDDLGKKVRAIARGSEPYCYSNDTAMQSIDLRKLPHINAINNFTIDIDHFTGNKRGVLAGSVAAPWADQIIYQDTFRNDCDVLVARGVRVIRKRFNATTKDTSFTVTFQSAFCEESNCSTKENTWRGTVYYNKECTVSSDMSHSENVAFGSSSLFASKAFVDILDESGVKISVSSVPVTLANQMKGFLQFGISDIRLPSGNQDTLWIELQIPQGFVLTNLDFLLSGVRPVSIQEIGQGSNRTFRVAYLMPLESYGSILVPFVIDCFEVVPPDDCDLSYTKCACSPPLVMDKVSIYNVLQTSTSCQTTYLPQGCNSQSYQIICDNIETCYKDTLAGGFQYVGRLFRTSYGKPDPEFDGKANEGEPHMPEKYQIYNFIAGDSLKITFDGKIITNIPGSTFDNLVLRLSQRAFTANDPVKAEFYESLLTGQNGAIKTYDSKIKIIRKRTGEKYVFNRAYERYLDNDIFIHLSADTLTALYPDVAFPTDFRFEEGDSVYVELLKVIDVDHFYRAKDEINRGDFFEFSTYMMHYLGDDIPESDFEFSPCDCYAYTLYFPAMMMSSIPVSSNVSYQSQMLCNDAFTSINFLNISFGHTKVLPLPKGFIFPNEVREMIRPVKIKIEKSKDVAFDNITILYLGEVFRINPVEEGNYYVYDLASAGMLPAGAFSTVEQKHVFKLSLSVRPIGCVNFTPPLSSALKIYFDLSPAGKIYFPDSITTQINISFPQPEMQLALFQKEVTAFSNDFSTKFTVCCPTLIQTADNVYIRITNASDNISGLLLKDTITGEIFNPVNGIFNTGPLGRNQTRFFELFGTSKGCGKEKLVIEYGLDCQPYTDPAILPCFRNYDSLEIHFPKGLVDMITEQSNNEVWQLCDTILQKATFYNAGLGTVHDMRITLQLPPGVKIAAGSAVLYYPSGTKDFQIALPDVASQDGKYVWSLKDIWDLHAISGLAGATSVPENGFDVVFWAVTDCESTGGLPVLYHLTATDGCGNPVNSLTRAGATLYIDHGDVQEYIDVALVADFTDACRRDRMKLVLNTTRPTSLSSKIFVSLPSGWEVDPSTITGNLHNNTPYLSQGLYTWNPASDDEDITITFEIINSNNNYCITDNIAAYISSPASAFCIHSGTPCDVNVVAGSATIPLTIQQPQYTWINSSLFVENGKIYVQGSLEQTTDLDKLQSLSAKIIIDLNGNGHYDTGDMFVGNMMFDSFDAFGLSTQIVVLDEHQLSSICNLLLVLDSDENCICDNITIPVRDITYRRDIFSICSGDTVSLGINHIPDHFYQWNEAVGLSCTQCASTTFSVPNHSGVPVKYTKILSETFDSGCNIRYLYDITVNPLPNVKVENLTLCQGDTLFIISTPAVDYDWSGPNILQDNRQTLIALPDSSAQYQYMLTNEYGCTTSGTVRVNVDIRPELQIVHDSVLCASSEATIQVQVANTTSFAWTDGAERLSDRQVLNPGIIVQQDYDFGLQLINGTCRVDAVIPVRFYPVGLLNYFHEICAGETYKFGNQDIDQNGRYCMTLQSINGCDSTVCVQLNVRMPEVFHVVDTLTKEDDISLIIHAPVGFSGYHWSPDVYLSCTDCPSAMTDTPEDITYIVQLYDDIGCLSEKRYRIVVKETCKDASVTLPNAFSPNNDGINDVYTLKDVALCGKMHIRVYNRWGNLVFEDVDWNNQWDGRSGNGENLPQGTYFIEIVFGRGFVKSGIVDLRKQ